MDYTKCNNAINALNCWLEKPYNCNECAYEIVDPDGMARCNLPKLHKDSIEAFAELKNIIHCKDCKYSHMTYGGECKYCDKISAADDDGEYGEAMYVPGDFYCRFGERRQI